METYVCEEERVVEEWRLGEEIVPFRIASFLGRSRRLWDNK